MLIGSPFLWDKKRHDRHKGRAAKNADLILAIVQEFVFGLLQVLGRRGKPQTAPRNRFDDTTILAKLESGWHEESQRHTAQRSKSRHSAGKPAQHEKS
jgi:hypothetical protein